MSCWAVLLNEIVIAAVAEFITYPVEASLLNAKPGFNPCLQDNFHEADVDPRPLYRDIDRNTCRSAKPGLH